MQYTVEMMSKVLGVSSSGFYKWLKINPKIAAAKALVKKQVATIFKKSGNSYGSPRIALEMNKHGKHISKSTISRIMNSLNIQARPKRKFIHTTNSDHQFEIPDNKLNRNFNVETINTVWVSDITYIRVASHWMYLTVIIDLADRMVVGWTLSNNMTAKDTIINAFEKAVKQRGLTRDHNLMFHSDRGVQYACNEFRDLIQSYNCIQSMSRKGNCWDNAVSESFFKTIKTEKLDKYIFNNNKTLKTFIFNYIDGWYNTVRIHTSLNGKSPLDKHFELIKKLAA